MIQRPQKRIGGSIGLEIDAIWQAMARLEVTGDEGFLVDHTTRGAQVRTRAGIDSDFAALFCVTVAPSNVGLPFKARRVVAGYALQDVTDAATGDTFKGMIVNGMTTDPDEEDIYYAAFLTPLSGFGMYLPSPDLPSQQIRCPRYNYSRAVGEIFVAIKVQISTAADDVTPAGSALTHFAVGYPAPTWIDAGFFTDFNTPTGLLSNPAPVNPNTGCVYTPGDPALL